MSQQGNQDIIGFGKGRALCNYLIPLNTWKELLLAWQRLIDLLEDQEDRAIFNEWLEKRATGEAQTISLEELEQELGEDGSLSG